MTNDLTKPPDDDDGFVGSSSGRGHDFLRWNAENQWIDRDGCAAPSPLLAIKVDEILRMWKDDRPTDITTKPLPDPDDLNAKIPQDEWEEGKDGKPRPPWAHHVVVYLVDPETATKYVYAASTVGAHIAVEQLKENVVTMRMLRGTRVMPLVKLSSRPMKTKFKMSERPHFEIINWHASGGGGEALAPPTAPQLTGPTEAEPQPVTIETRPSEPRKDPISSGPQADQTKPGKSRKAKPKPKVEATLDVMGKVKPVTSAEILDDELPW